MIQFSVISLIRLDTCTSPPATNTMFFPDPRFTGIPAPKVMLLSAFQWVPTAYARVNVISSGIFNAMNPAEIPVFAETADVHLGASK
jgi:hypothetical protein